MNPNMPLELRDIHGAGDPSWWPPAPGWWLLAALCLLGLFCLFRATRARRQRRRVRRAALAELQGICAQWEANAQGGALLKSLSELLRRVALVVSPPAAALSGAHWLEWLDTFSRGRDFSDGPGRVLTSGPYRPDVEFDARELIRIVRRALSTGLA